MFVFGLSTTVYTKLFKRQLFLLTVVPFCVGRLPPRFFGSLGGCTLFKLATFVCSG